MNKNELLIFQAAQLLQEIRIDRRDARQVRRKVVAAFELLRQAGYEFDEEYIQEYIKHCQVDGRHARNAALNYNDLLNSLSQPKEYYEKLLENE
jgi:hypothetical protein